MRRRQLIRYAGASLLAASGTALVSGWGSDRAQAQSGGSLTVEYLGHTCFLFTGGGRRVLVNPFRALGCTAGYRVPKVQADLVLVSSLLWDEGSAEGLPGNPKVLYEPGVYEIGGIRFQGISIAHDREGGRRFGNNVAWRWNQGGIRVLHLGGAAAPIEVEQRILMGNPDLALIPVGGGSKAYDPQEAKQAMESLKPKVMIPTQYLTAAADKNACDLVPVDEFLKLVEGMNIRKINGNSLSLSAGNIPKEGTVIRVLSY
jgi:L-ascorbate metabolism protein UlaG (beta-lactamase superfamily)